MTPTDAISLLKYLEFKFDDVVAKMAANHLHGRDEKVAAMHNNQLKEIGNAKYELNQYLEKELQDFLKQKSQP